MTHPLIVEVRAALERAADPVKAPQMQAYMKSAMPYRGVSSPEQKAIWKAVFLAHPLPSSEQVAGVALTLWRDATFREERYGADRAHGSSAVRVRIARWPPCRCSRR